MCNRKPATSSALSCRPHEKGGPIAADGPLHEGQLPGRGRLPPPATALFAIDVEPQRWAGPHQAVGHQAVGQQAVGQRAQRAMLNADNQRTHGQHWAGDTDTTTNPPPAPHLNQQTTKLHPNARQLSVKIYDKSCSSNTDTLNKLPYWTHCSTSAVLIPTPHASHLYEHTFLNPPFLNPQNKTTNT